MFIVDKILMSPVTGVLWIMKELHKHVQQEQAQEADRLTAKLSELYMLLETNQLSEADFEAQESVILDRLDEIQKNAEAGIEDDQDDADAEANADDDDTTDDDDSDSDTDDDTDGREADGDGNDSDSDDDSSSPKTDPQAITESPDDIEAMLIAEIESRTKPPNR